MWQREGGSGGHRGEAARSRPRSRLQGGDVLAESLRKGRSWSDEGLCRLEKAGSEERMCCLRNCKLFRTAEPVSKPAQLPRVPVLSRPPACSCSPVTCTAAPRCQSPACRELRCHLCSAFPVPRYRPLKGHTAPSCQTSSRLPPAQAASSPLLSRM